MIVSNCFSLIITYCHIVYAVPSSSSDTVQPSRTFVLIFKKKITVLCLMLCHNFQIPIFQFTLHDSMSLQILWLQCHISNPRSSSFKGNWIKLDGLDTYELVETHSLISIWVPYNSILPSCGV